MSNNRQSTTARIIKRTKVDGTVKFVIQQRHFIFFWWWVDAWVNNDISTQDSFLTLEEAKKHLCYFDGSKAKEEIIIEMKKKLKSLDEHNSNSWSNYSSMFENSPKPNGIACPKCGEELMDSQPMVTLTFNPPKKDIHCPSCGYVGYRIA